MLNADLTNSILQTLDATQLPEFLFHHTERRLLPPVYEEGIHRQSRRHVHMMPTVQLQQKPRYQVAIPIQVSQLDPTKLFKNTMGTNLYEDDIQPTALLKPVTEQPSSTDKR